MGPRRPQRVRKGCGLISGELCALCGLVSARFVWGLRPASISILDLARGHPAVMRDAGRKISPGEGAADRDYWRTIGRAYGMVIDGMERCLEPIEL